MKSRTVATVALAAIVFAGMLLESARSLLKIQAQAESCEGGT